MSSEVFYITTPIYYVNDVPHVGHAYCTIGADVMARYKRAMGREVFFLTGTDEHGQKIEKSAKEKGFPSPLALADSVVVRFQELWKKLEITNDDFIRTTQERHKKSAQKFFQAVFDAGYIEKRAYKGWYCVHEETFWPETQLAQPGNLCPDCKRPCQESEETNYFFKQSAFKQALLDHLKAHPDFVSPEVRRNELLGSYLEAADGVNDLSITRASLKWGIPTPVDAGQVIYVWFDALINYITAAGYGWDEARFARIWPADVHLIGKDILRFHALLWPAMLLAAGLKLPGKVFGTGFILNAGVKMSKSLGNSVDPGEWAGTYGVDVLRYYLLREVPFGSDGTISLESIEKRYNSDLANDLGNLLNRSLTMIEKYCAGRIPGPPASSADKMAEAGKAFKDAYGANMEKMAFHEALENIFGLVRVANRYIDEQAPWKMAKDPAKAGELNACMYNLAETLRQTGLALAPFMPATAPKILAQLGLNPQEQFGDKGALKGRRLDEALAWGGLAAGISVAKGAPLFPRREAAPARQG